VHGLKLESLRVLNKARLRQSLENRRPQAPACRFVPQGHLRISRSAAAQIVFPNCLCEPRSEDAKLFPKNQIEKIADEGTVLDNRGQRCVSGDCLASVAHKFPQISVHCLKSLTDEPSEPGSGFRTSRLKNIFMLNFLGPRLVVNAGQQEVCDNPALPQFKSAGGDLRAVAVFAAGCPWSCVWKSFCVVSQISAKPPVAVDTRSNPAGIRPTDLTPVCVFKRDMIRRKGGSCQQFE
jgi:hypothetical protein